jgi:hypothetical protein
MCSRDVKAGSVMISKENDGASTGPSFVGGTVRSRRPDDVLRFGFLPSDFHPMVLFLGEREAMRAFASVLEQFARESTDVQLHACDFSAPADGISITLTGTGAMSGMHPLGDDRNAFTWTVEPWQAELFADMVADLAKPGRKSGSAVLECRSVGETPVKVSLGEFTDDFLTSADD